MLTSLGRIGLKNLDEFSENFQQGGGEGHFRSKKLATLIFWKPSKTEGHKSPKCEN